MIFAQPHVSILQQSYLQLGHGPLLPTLTVVLLLLGPQQLPRRRRLAGGRGSVGVQLEVFQQLLGLFKDFQVSRSMQSLPGLAMKWYCGTLESIGVAHIGTHILAT